MIISIGRLIGLAITCPVFKPPWLWQSSSCPSVFSWLIATFSLCCFFLCSQELGKLISGWFCWKKPQLCSVLCVTLLPQLPDTANKESALALLKEVGSGQGAVMGQSQPGTVGFGRVLCKGKSGGIFESSYYGNQKSVTFLKFYPLELCICISTDISLLIFVEKSKHH